MTGLTVRYLGFDGLYFYYTGTDDAGCAEYTHDVKLARLMNERHATHAAQAVANDGHHPEITTTTLE